MLTWCALGAVILVTVKRTDAAGAGGAGKAPKSHSIFQDQPASIELIQNVDQPVLMPTFSLRTAKGATLPNNVMNTLTFHHYVIRYQPTPGCAAQQQQAVFTVQRTDQRSAEQRAQNPDLQNQQGFRFEVADACEQQEFQVAMEAHPYYQDDVKLEYHATNAATGERVSMTAAQTLRFQTEVSQLQVTAPENEAGWPVVWQKQRDACCPFHAVFNFYYNEFPGQFDQDLLGSNVLCVCNMAATQQYYHADSSDVVQMLQAALARQDKTCESYMYFPEQRADFEAQMQGYFDAGLDYVAVTAPLADANKQSRLDWLAYDKAESFSRKSRLEVDAWPWEYRAIICSNYDHFRTAFALGDLTWVDLDSVGNVYDAERIFTYRNKMWSKISRCDQGVVILKARR